MNLVKRLFQHGVDRFKRGKGCEAQRGKAVWQHQSDAKQGALRDLTFRTEANMQAIYMLIDSPSTGCPSTTQTSTCRTNTDVSRPPFGLHRGKSAVLGLTGTYWDGSWRRGWDSNPRYACAYSGFRDRHVQPLRHLSGWADFTSALTRRLYDLEIPHVGLQNRRNIHTAVGALIVLHDRNQRAPDG